jgi:hypothetical protein
MFEEGYSREKRVNSEQIIIRSSEKTIINSFYIFVCIIDALCWWLFIYYKKKRTKENTKEPEYVYIPVCIDRTKEMRRLSFRYCDVRSNCD